MGENECLGWFPRYTPSQPMCNDVGCATNVSTIASAKSVMDAMAERYKPIADKLVEAIYESSQNAPLLFTNPTTRKARKHYKPKFTL